MGAGSGGFYVALAEFNRVKREMNQYHRDRSNRHNARLARLARARATANQPPRDKKTPYPCMHLCAECNLLAESPQLPCPSCNRSDWIDLSDEVAADNLRDVEERQRHQIPTRFRLLLAGVLILVWVGIFLLMRSYWVVLAGVPLFVVAYSLLKRPLAWWLFRSSENTPNRWRLPVPGSEAETTDTRTTNGLPRRCDGYAVAPFSGRRCLGYQVSVLFDTPGDARPAEWVLQEASNVAFEVDDARVDPERALVQTQLELIDEVHPDFHLERFLRERGLFAEDGAYWFFEAILDEKRPVDVSFHDGLATVVPTSGRAVDGFKKQLRWRNEEHGTTIDIAEQPAESKPADDPNVKLIHQGFWSKTWSLFAPNIRADDIWYRRVLVYGYFFIVGYVIAALALFDSDVTSAWTNGCSSFSLWLIDLSVGVFVSSLFLCYLYVPAALIIGLLIKHVFPQSSSARRTVGWTAFALSISVVVYQTVSLWLSTCP